MYVLFCQASVADDGGESLDYLERLNLVKERMTQSAHALSQADNWTTTVNELEEVSQRG